MGEREISAVNPYPYKRVRVLESEIAYIQAGSGPPILFMHGNPTSSYIWRNVIPHLEGLGTCLAPDLIGMGRSGKIPGFGYRFPDHARYVQAWIDAVVPEGQLTFVAHDWGAALSFDWGNRHRRRVKAVCYMEAMVQPRRWSDLPEAYEKAFRAFRTEEGLQKALEENLFIEKALPNGVTRTLTEEEMAAYRAPFEKVEDRVPTIVWPREIPFDGDPADNHQRVQRYADWLAASGDTPKLFVNTSHGHALIGRNRDFCRAWPNQEEITLHGKHYIQEDSPHELGEAVADWIRRI